MTKVITQRPQARALARRVRGRRPKEPDDQAARRDAAAAEPEESRPRKAKSVGLGTAPPDPPEIEVYRPSPTGGSTYTLSGDPRDADEPPSTESVFRPPLPTDLLPSLSQGLLAYLRRHLTGGETHYPPRAGLPELRERVAAHLSGTLIPGLAAGGVLITAGEGEALFVTLLGCRIAEGDRVRMSGDWKTHSELLSILDVEPVPAESDVTDGPRDQPHVVVLGRGLVNPDVAPHVDPGSNVVYVGSLSGLPEMIPFRLGFVAGDPELVSRILDWKRAFSICSSGPSQRAALHAFSREDRPTLEEGP